MKKPAYYAGGATESDAAEGGEAAKRSRTD